MEKQKIAYREIPINLSVDFSAESLQARRSADMIYLKWWKEGKTYNQDCTIKQVSHSDLTKKSKVYRQAKAKRIQHYQTSLTINACLGRKKRERERERRKKLRKTNTKQLKVKVKMSVAQLCLTLCSPMDCSPPDSSARGIFQARIVECVAIPFSRLSSQARDWT